MSFKLNGKKISKKTLLKKIEDPSTIITKVTIDIPNDNKEDGPVTMEGFDIPKDLIISMAERSTALNGSVTATYSNCGKLGGKTVIITVKDTDPEEI